MSQIVPEGEAVRNAVKWISSECKENLKSNLNQLICQAAEKYNLSPKDEEFLRVFYLKDNNCEQ